MIGFLVLANERERVTLVGQTFLSDIREAKKFGRPRLVEDRAFAGPWDLRAGEEPTASGGRPSPSASDIDSHICSDVQTLEGAYKLLAMIVLPTNTHFLQQSHRRSIDWW